MHVKAGPREQLLLRALLGGDWMATQAGGKMIYRFAEGSADMVNLLGSKGAHASEMARIGIPVPPGFVITTEASLDYYH